MGRFSKSNTILYRRFNRESDSGYEIRASICFILTCVTKNYYSLPYFAVRKTGIDYIFKTYSARKVIEWEEVLKLEASVSTFRFILKSGDEFVIKFSEIDFSSVQIIKESFSSRGLLVSITSSKPESLK